MNSVAMVIGYVVVIYYIATVIYGNLYRYHKVDPHEACRIGAKNIIVGKYSMRSFNGDGVSMSVWSAYPSSEDLLRLVDRRQIEQGRIWFSGPFDTDSQKAFEWLTKHEEYATIKEYVEQIVNGDYFYSIDTLNMQDDNLIGNCGMWLVSPRLRLIAYLDCDT